MTWRSRATGYADARRDLALEGICGLIAQDDEKFLEFLPSVGVTAGDQRHCRG
jgi:hypothetical protein